VSLINEALKTAQSQRSKLLRPRIEHPLFEAVVPYASRSGRSRQTRLPLLLGFLGLVVVGFVGVGMYAPRFLTGGLFKRSGIRSIPRPVAAAAPVPAVSIDAKAPAPVEQAGRVPAADSSRASVPRAKAPALIEHPAIPAAKPIVVATRPAAAAPLIGSDTSERVADAPVAPPSPPVAATRAASPSTSGVQVTVEAGGVRPVDALMAQALTAQRQGDLRAAKQLYDRAIKTGPVSAPLYNNYGALLTATGDARNAIAMLRLALSLDRTLTNAWVNLGNALDAVGDHTNAVGAFHQALKLDPNNREGRVYVAEQYLALSSYAEARRMAEAIVNVDPAYAPGQYVLGRALEGVKEFRGAVSAFTRFLELGGAAGNSILDAQVRSHIAALRAQP
jgi:hypothetical protein